MGHNEELCRKYIPARLTMYSARVCVRVRVCVCVCVCVHGLVRCKQITVLEPMRFVGGLLQAGSSVTDAMILEASDKWAEFV